MSKKMIEGLQLLDDRILIKPNPHKEKTESGIYIPDSVQRETEQGMVCAVGDSEDVTLKEGDVVIFNKHSGEEIIINNEDYLLMKEFNAYAIIIEN